MSLLKGDFVYREAPITINRAVGSRLYSNDRNYLDLQAASGAAILGYDNSVIEAIDFGDMMLAKPQTLESETRIRFANHLVARTEGAVGRVGRIGFELGGAQAIELALKVAISANPRFYIISIEGAYHGRSLFTSHLSSSRRYALGLDSNSRHIRLPNPMLTATYAEEDRNTALAYCIQHVEEIFNDERFGVIDAGAVPIFVYEPIQNVAGMIDLPHDYLKAIERCVRNAGGVNIVDEIFSGMHRFGPLFAHHEKGLTPDIIVMSKGMTNGIVPLSTIWVSDESKLAETYRPGTHSCTYLNGELAFLISEVVFSRLDAIEKLSDLNIGKKFLEAIEGRFSDVSSLDVFARGNVLRLDFKSAELSAKFSNRIFKRPELGLMHATTGLAKSSVIFHPAFTIADDELDQAGEICAEALINVL